MKPIAAFACAVGVFTLLALSVSSQEPQVGTLSRSESSKNANRASPGGKAVDVRNRNKLNTGSHNFTLPKYGGCYATLLGTKTIITTRDCLYDFNAKRSLLPLQFTLKGRSVQITQVIPPKTFGGNEYNYAIGILETPMAVSKAELGMTYKALEDIELSLKTTNNYLCRSGEKLTTPRLRRLNSAVMRMSCKGLPLSTLNGSPLFYTDPISKVVTIVGIHQGKCARDTCATRIHGHIFQHVCAESTKKRLSVPGCMNTLFSKGQLKTISNCVSQTDQSGPIPFSHYFGKLSQC